MPNPTLSPPVRRHAAVSLATFAVVAFALAAASGCTREGEGSTTGQGEGRTSDSAAGTIGIPSRKVPPYNAIAVANPGTIRGSLDLTAVPTPRSTACPAPASGERAIVWLDDIRRGLDVPADRKLDRRLELVAGRCKLEPRLQLGLVGSTLNVRNDDGVAHLVRLFRDGESDPIYQIPFIFSGQLVPAHRPLTVPGILEARSSQDPSLRSLVVLVDHPYAATVNGDGNFVIDSVPPGRYKLMAMNAHGGAEQLVEVAGARETVVTLQLRGR